MYYKFTLKANKLQAGLDKPHEHVVDLKGGKDIRRRYQAMSVRPRAWQTSGSPEVVVRLPTTLSVSLLGKTHRDQCPAASFPLSELCYSQAVHTPLTPLPRPGHSQRLRATVVSYRTHENGCGPKHSIRPCFYKMLGILKMNNKVKLKQNVRNSEQLICK